jgi:hypothetical protein
MAKRTSKSERRRLNKLLNNGTVATDGDIKIQHDICSICLQYVDAECSYCSSSLDCGHRFHGECLLQWFKKSNNKQLRLIKPYTDLDIQFFPEHTNCMRCPMCRVEYTKELHIDESTWTVKQKDSTMKRILGRISMLYCEDDKQGPIIVTHYVINTDTFKLFSPFCEIDDDDGQPVTLYKRCY